MKNLKYNEPLTMMIIEKFCKEPKLTLFVHSSLLEIAEEITQAYIQTFSFVEDGEKLSIFKAIEKGYIRTNIRVLPASNRLITNPDEWILITDEEMFYSGGTNETSTDKNTFIK